MDRVTQNIYEDTNEMSDLALQEKLWLNRNNGTGLISSYDELLCRLIYDNRVEDFVGSKEAIQNLSERALPELKLLIALFKSYKPKEDDEEIWNDPAWLRIVQQAKIARTEWDKCGWKVAVR